MPTDSPDLTGVPEYLRLAGGLRPTPKRLDKVIRCPQCRAFLGRSDLGYSCPRSLTHTRLVGAADFEARVRKAARLPAAQADALVALVRRRARYQLRFGLGDDAVAPLRRKRKRSPRQHTDAQQKDGGGG